MRSNAGTPLDTQDATPVSPTLLPDNRWVRLWQTDFPLNARTLLFCFLSGSVWSIPVGLLVVTRWQMFAAPLWTAPIYAGAVSVSLLVLPLWGVFGLRDQPLLRWAALACTPAAIAAVVILLNLLPPSL